MSSASSKPASKLVLAGTSRVLQIGLAKQTGRNSCYAATASAAYNFVSPDHKITERAVCKYVADVKRSSSKNASPRTTEIEDPILFLQGHHAFSSAIDPTDAAHGKGPGLCGVIKYEIDDNVPLLMLLNEHYVTVVGYRVNVECNSNAINPNVFDILISDPDPQEKSDYWYNLGSLTKYENPDEPRMSATIRTQLSLVKPAVLPNTGQTYRGIVLLKNPQTASSKPLSPSAARDKFYSPSPTSPKKTKTGRVSAAKSKRHGGIGGHGRRQRTRRW